MNYHVSQQNKISIFNFYFLMELQSFQTPRRSRKITIEASVSDQRYKYSTIESRFSKDSKGHRQSNHWTNHQKRRDNRTSSLFKARKAKLEEITGENKKIFIRINQQQSHYPSGPIPDKDKNPIKYRPSQEKILGPIANWTPPDCFITGSRGIMCERNLGLQTATLKPEKKRLPSLSKIGTPERGMEKENCWEEALPKQAGGLYFTPSRQRNLSDLYMLS